MIRSFRARLTVSVAFVVLSALFVLSAVAGATTDPNLTSAESQATSYFSANIAKVVEGFLAVAGALWLLTMLFNSIGIRRKRAI